jgi:hypothetical protein
MKDESVWGATLQNEKYTVNITEVQSFTLDSTDNEAFDFVMNPRNLSRHDWYKTLCISVTEAKSMRIALIVDPLTSGQGCAILEGDILTVLQNDRITQIDLGTVQMIANHELDIFGTTFSIHRLLDGYLIYGEIEIIRLDDAFQAVWKFSGKDIFVSVTGKQPFELTDETIKLYDFEDNFYELDYNGNVIREVLRG